MSVEALFELSDRELEEVSGGITIPSGDHIILNPPGLLPLPPVPGGCHGSIPIPPHEPPVHVPPFHPWL